MELTVSNSKELFDAIQNINSSSEDANLIINEGVYEIHEDIVIKKNNVKIIGQGEVILKGSKKIDIENAPREGELIVIDLEKEGVTDLGEFGLGPYEDFWRVYDIPKPHMCDFGPGLELFYEDKLMPISRYPKQGFINIEKSLGQTPMYFKDTQNGTKEGIFTCCDKSINSWTSYKEWLLVGYWNADWATQRHTLKSFENGVMEVNEPYHSMGYRDGLCYTSDKGAIFCILNALEAVTEPGEWFIDRANKKLYIYPYEGQKYIEISTANNIISGKNVNNISIENLNLSQCRKTAIYFEDSSKIYVNNCVVKNSGAWGMLCENCTDSIIERSEVSLTGGGGIGVNGGDRNTLTPANNTIKNCKIHNIARWHKTYMAALDISGVGCTLSENYIYDVPHFGIVYAGNNHLIEKNEINNACYESNDAGAIYSGRDYTFRGNVIRYNYLHDLYGYDNHGCIGLYFDDAVSSAEVYGNIFANMPYIGLLLGGGRDFKIYNNSFFNCKMSIMYDKRASTWAAYKNGGGKLGQHLREIDYKSDIWKNAYPELYIIEENNMFMPMGNSITDNVVIGGDGFALQSKDIEDITEIHGNSFANMNYPEEHDKYHADWYYITK